MGAGWGQSAAAVVQAGRGGRVVDVAGSDGSRSAMSDLPGMMRDPVGVRLVPARVPGLSGQHLRRGAGGPVKTVNATTCQTRGALTGVMEASGGGVALGG
jgi:hypothetical protein